MKIEPISKPVNLRGKYNRMLHEFEQSGVRYGAINCKDEKELNRVYNGFWRETTRHPNIIVTMNHKRVVIENTEAAARVHE